MKARDVPEELSQQAHRRLIGVLGLLLPALVYLVAGTRPTDGLQSWRLLSAVSDYYYTGAVVVLVGVLVSLSLFLVTYPGYEGVKADRIVSVTGGVATFAVAFFPTNAPHGVVALSWWRPWMGVVHIIAAIAMFVAFILFSVWLFRRSNIPKRRDRPAPKRRRDDICLACGLVMIACVAWSIAAGLMGASIFAPEAIAIEAFAISWLVKGEIIEWIQARLRSTP